MHRRWRPQEIELEKSDEIECTILGLHLLLTTLSDEVYTTFEVVDLNSLAASRVKIIQTKIYTRICLVLALVLVYYM
ncbi:hypothetical protein PR003_g28335 [Phytophthora rubi]|uniref:Uncharacterized protein n=1 Tax=Phytophthora rubi TaxID=129364 RepID=A0A6A3HAA0_9STRA|nr:hypothetical protein PR002_g28623 [Phytophthora rubi]KAE8968520.1 hypothetical protein PR001_g27764 [Phytophthora rubi]KAE9279066.1 hypothetical protein PR003_g28335 [Phytophthora rubi]